MSQVLVIEDDPDIRLSLRYALEREEFSVTTAPDGESGLAQAILRLPDLVLLDLGLPGTDGQEICQRLRQDKRTATVPIIMLTARVEESDKLAGLAHGADDYVTKPFSIKELIARVRALLRRARTPLDRPELLVHAGLELDEARRSVVLDGRPIELTRKEFDLLADLMRGSGRVASREQLLERVWGYDHPGLTRTVDVHVRQLRKKLGPGAAGLIETVVGVGYRFRLEP